MDRRLLPGLAAFCSPRSSASSPLPIHLPRPARSPGALHTLFHPCCCVFLDIVPRAPSHLPLNFFFFSPPVPSSLSSSRPSLEGNSCLPKRGLILGFFFLF